MDGKTEEKTAPKRRIQDPEKERRYAVSLSGLFDELLECSLKTGACRTVFCTEDRPGLSGNITIASLREFAWTHIHPHECRRFLSAFGEEHLRDILKSAEEESFTFRQRLAEGGYVWQRALIVPAMGEEEVLLCYVKALGAEGREREHLKQIVDRYVYRICDYLICIDTKNDSYSVFCCKRQACPNNLDHCGSYSAFIQALLEACALAEDRDVLEREMDTAYVLPILEKEGEHVCSCGFTDKEGGYRRKELQFMYYDKSRGMILLMQKDVTKDYLELRRYEDRLKEALNHAKVDSLTGLYNRQAVGTQISRLLKEKPGECSALLFLDLDNFKMVNDTLGHRCGDQVLCQAAHALKKALRPSDVIGRVGGDEFVAFLPGLSSQKEAKDCALRLCQAMNHIPALADKDLKLSCSVGGAVCPEDGRDYDALLVKADAAVYEAKRRGKNQSAFFGPDMDLKSDGGGGK